MVAGVGEQDREGGISVVEGGAAAGAVAWFDFVGVVGRRVFGGVRVCLGFFVNVESDAPFLPSPSFQHCGGDFAAQDTGYAFADRVLDLVFFHHAL